MQVITPIVHLNGTSRESLIDGLLEVYNRLEGTREAWRRAAPNGRDYYLEPGRLEKAESQHRRRLEAIDHLQNDIEAEMNGISDQP